MVDRPLLPLLRGSTHHTSRDAMTCLYRCGNACDHPIPNQSGNPYLGDVINAGMSRRGLVRAGAVGALVLSVGAPAAPAAAAETAGATDAVTGRAGALT